MYAAIPKIWDPNSFAKDIANYQMLPDVFVPWLALFLPVFELLAGAALLASIYVRGAALAVAMMLVVFIVGIAQAILRGIDIDCGCFGQAARTQVSWSKVVEDVIYLLMTVPLINRHWVPWWNKTRWVSDTPHTSSTGASQQNR